MVCTLWGRKDGQTTSLCVSCFNSPGFQEETRLSACLVSHSNYTMPVHMHVHIINIHVHIITCMYTL